MDKKANKRGFTLIELLVSISIIALLSGLFLVNYRSTNKRSELNMAKQRLASDIRQAQNNSLGAKTYDGVNTPAGGWGAHFELTSPTNYIIFADKDEDQAYDPNDNEMMETRILPTGVTISALNPANTVDVVFLPPDPKTYVNGADDIDAQITLEENIASSTATLSINFFGLIDTD